MHFLLKFCNRPAEQTKTLTFTLLAVHFVFTRGKAIRIWAFLQHFQTGNIKFLAVGATVSYFKTNRLLE